MEETSPLASVECADVCACDHIWAAVDAEDDEWDMSSDEPCEPRDRWRRIMEDLAKYAYLDVAAGQESVLLCASCRQSPVHVTVSLRRVWFWWPQDIWNYKYPKLDAVEETPAPLPPIRDWGSATSELLQDMEALFAAGAEPIQQC